MGLVETHEEGGVMPFVRVARLHLKRMKALPKIAGKK